MTSLGIEPARATAGSGVRDPGNRARRDEHPDQLLPTAGTAGRIAGPPGWCDGDGRPRGVDVGPGPAERAEEPAVPCPPATTGAWQPDVVRFMAPGYALNLCAIEVDIYRFEGLVHRGRAARARGDEQAGAETSYTRRSVSTVAPPFHGLERVHTRLGVESQRLGELRLAAIEDRIAANLTLGEDPAALVCELTPWWLPTLCGSAYGHRL